MTKRRLINGMTLFFAFVAVLFTVTACGNTKKEFNLNFDVDGVVTVVEATAKQEVSLPEEPSKDGYSFEGWYLDKDVWADPFTENTVIEKKIKEETTVYAKFDIITYTIEYQNTKDAENGNVTTYNVNTETFDLEDISVTGYKFSGWSTGSGIIKSIPTGSTGDVVLTAVWDEEVYDITYNNVEGATHKNPALYTVVDDISLADASKEGYIFKGWSDGTSVITTIPAGSTGPKTLTATWEEEVYNITYDGVSDATYTNVATYTINDEIVLVNAVKEGYAFMGWSDGTGIITTIPAGSTGPKTLTATWEEDVLTLTYDNTKLVISDEGDITADMFAAKCTNLEGKTVDITATIIGDRVAGETVKVKLSAEYNTKSVEKTIWNVRVYGTPTIANRDLTEYVYLDNNLSMLFKGTDSFGADTEVIFTTTSETWQTEDTVTIIATAIDVAGNKSTTATSTLNVIKENSKDLFEVEQYIHNSKGCRITSYINAENDIEDIIIPFEINGLYVQIIGKEVYKDNTVIKSVYMPNCLELINESAFNGCINLSTVLFSNTISSIGDYAFAGSGIKSLVFPDTLDFLQDGVFYNCASLEEISVPDDVYMSRQMFYGCTSLKTFVLPSNMQEIHPSFFYGCTSLNNIVIPNSVNRLSTEAFYGCTSLSNLTISDNVEHLSMNVFDGTAWLDNHEKNTTGLVYVGKIAFRYFGEMAENTVVDIKDGTTIIGEALFSCRSNLKAVNIPDSVEMIQTRAFEGSGLESIYIPDSVTWLDGQIFSGCKKLTEARLPANIIVFGNSIFYYCSALEKVILPTESNIIGRSTFGYCTGLTSITIPENIEEIGIEAFQACTGLKEIFIPATVKKMGEAVFVGCTGIKIYCEVSLPQLEWAYNWTSYSSGGDKIEVYWDQTGLPTTETTEE